MELVAIPRQVVDEAIDVLVNCTNSQSVLIGKLMAHCEMGRGLRVNDDTIQKLKSVYEMYDEIMYPTARRNFDPRFCDVFLQVALNSFREFLVKEVRGETHK